MTTPRQTCAPSAIAHPVNAAVVSLEPDTLSGGLSDWLTIDGNAMFRAVPGSARTVAAERAAKYERIAAGLRAFAGEPGVCERPANTWPWPCDDNAATVPDAGWAAVSCRARMSHLRNDVCAPAPRLAQP